MDIHTITSSGLDAKLKCFLCQNYLSYFPISLSSNNQSLCGRCTPPEDITFYHNEVYETLCQFLKFPCRYKSEGCTEELLPQQVPQHEETCSNRRVSCIVKKPNPCDWVGALPNLLSHCTYQHGVLQNRFEMDISLSHAREYLIENNKSLLILTSKYNRESKIWQCAIHSHQYECDHKSRPCQLKVKSGSTTVLHDFNTSSLAEKIFTKISLQFDDDVKSVVGEISIGDLSSHTTTSTTKFELEDIYSKISSLFECYNCSKIAVPHAYRRIQDMRVLCSKCSDYIKNRSCAVKSLQRDYVLDIIAHIPTYPCTNRKNGCKSMSRYNEMKTHEDICEYKVQICPFYGIGECKWRGVKNTISSHIVGEHQDLLVGSDSELSLTSGNVTVEYRAIKAFRCIFRLGYVLDSDNYFKWSVQAITGDIENLKYEVDLVDATKRGQRLLMRRFCSVLNEQEVFQDASKCCYFHKEQACLFSENKEDFAVIFKVHIFN